MPQISILIEKKYRAETLDRGDFVPHLYSTMESWILSQEICPKSPVFKTWTKYRSEWIHSRQEWIHSSMMEWIHSSALEWIHSNDQLHILFKKWVYISKLTSVCECKHFLVWKINILPESSLPHLPCIKLAIGKLWWSAKV